MLTACRRRTLLAALPPEEPIVLVEQTAKGVRITAANRAAVEAGAAAGLALNDARAACPVLRVEQADRDGDALLLARLAKAMMRYSPTVAIDGADGLFLDVDGCSHLFGGEAALIADGLARLKTAGFTARASLAPTPGAARAFASFSSKPEIVQEADLRVRIDALPIAALRLDEDRLVLLTRLGLKRVGDLRAMPRPVLERRFRSREAAHSVLLRLDQMTGDIREPIVPIAPPEPCREYLPCPEPAIHTDAIAAALGLLLARLQQRLEREGKGARHFRLSAFNTDGGSSEISVRLSRPSRDIGRISRLFTPKLDGIDCGFGIDAFLLAAAGVETIAPGQVSLVEDGDQQNAADDPAGFADVIAPLIDTLGNRLGPAAVYQLAPVESHIPEQADRRTIPGNTLGWAGWQAAKITLPKRPHRLFDRPQAVEVMAGLPDGPPKHFTWRRVKRVVVRASGPERIGPEWWLPGADKALERDYYVVEDAEGRQYWLYRHGLYSETNETVPIWYLHGLFT